MALAILKWDVVDNTLYSIEKRVEGIDLSKSLQKLQGAERVAALDSFYEGAMKISKLYESKRCYFKEAIHANGYPRSKHWPTFLAGVACKTLFRKFSNLERKELLEIFATRCGNINYSKAPELVHFDYFPANVIEYEGRVVAVIDYSLAIFGDPLLDVAGAVGYLPLEDRVTDRDYKHLLKMMFDHHTKEDITTMTTYLIYMAIYWSGCDSSRVAEWSAVIIDAWRKDNYKGSDTAIWEAITPKAKIKREGARYVSDM